LCCDPVSLHLHLLHVRNACITLIKIAHAKFSATTVHI
jgi:hypothetical protein